MAKRGRPRKTKDQKAKDALSRTEPNAAVMARRKLFSFVQPPVDERQDGRNGEIDSEICDGLGQLCAVGLLDGHGFDAYELRDLGRAWGNHLAMLLTRLGGAKVSTYERLSPSRDVPVETKADRTFDRMDAALGRGYERAVLHDLIVEPLISTSIACQEIAPWAKCLIDERLLQMGRYPRGVMRFPTMDDWGRLETAIRGLCWLACGTSAARYERAA